MSVTKDFSIYNTTVSKVSAGSYTGSQFLHCSERHASKRTSWYRKRAVNGLPERTSMDAGPSLMYSAYVCRLLWKMSYLPFKPKKHNILLSVGEKNVHVVMCAFLKVWQMTTSDPDCNRYRNLRTELGFFLPPKTRVYVCLRMPVEEGNNYPGLHNTVGVFIIQLFPIICKDKIH